MKLADIDVSRETIDRLKAYQGLLEKWNPTINLVAKSTMKAAWDRHIVDSAQVFALTAGQIDHWVDMGSGGGFPGLVVSVLAKEFEKPARVTLVESDARKCVFLRTVSRELELSTVIVSKRIEEAPPMEADVLSARALADLSTLCAFADRHLKPDGEALFMKGAKWRDEVEAAQSTWRFDYQAVKSKTEEGPAILRISGVSRA